MELRGSTLVSGTEGALIGLRYYLITNLILFSQRTFHLVSNPDLVLAVSMTKTRNDICGYPVIIQVRYVYIG